MISATPIIIISLFFIGAAFAFYKWVFLRDPERIIPEGDDLVVSPADGKIGLILRGKEALTMIPKGRYSRIHAWSNEIGDEWTLILIVMNLWHVHVQRSPIKGRIIEQRYHKGRFRNAVINDHLRTIENEHNEIIIESEPFNNHKHDKQAKEERKKKDKANTKEKRIKVKVIQIAGILARRIVTNVKKGDKVMKGERIGMIRLGSQAVLILPREFSILAKEGQEVKAGRTVLAIKKTEDNNKEDKKNKNRRQ